VLTAELLEHGMATFCSLKGFGRLSLIRHFWRDILNEKIGTFYNCTVCNFFNDLASGTEFTLSLITSS
jgi:hypothetical protein